MHTALALTALLYLLVSAQADRQITAARHTRQAVHDIQQARTTAVLANAALTGVAGTHQLALTGTGTDFANATARVTTLLTSAAQGNAAGAAGQAQIQFVQGQLTTCVQMAEAAATDPGAGAAILASAQKALTVPREKDPATGKPIPYTGGLTESLLDLSAVQTNALAAQRSSGWLDPVHTWVLLAGPAALILGCVAVSASVVVRRFRRPPSRRLALAWALAAAAGITGALLAHADAESLPGDPRLGHPLTTTLTLLALAAAGALAHFGYRPRLAEYRFPRP